MKETGSIRRVDDLGRIVIPREIREQLKIEIGEPLEVFAGEEGVMFKKYLPPFNKHEWARQACLTLPSNFRFLRQDSVVVVIELVTRNPRMGYAFCNPSDAFDLSVGCAIALSRAVGAEIPKEIFRED